MAARDHRPARVAFVSPAWPPGSLANGIVTYVANMRRGLSEHGVSSIVLTSMSQPDFVAEPSVFPLDEARPWALASGLLRGLRRLSRAHMVGPTIALNSLSVLGNLPAHERPDLVEMEESFGSSFWAQPFLDVPIVVRLHGPWFVAGPADNVPQDALFRRRVLAEGLAFRAAFLVTSPARDQLDKVRAHYGVGLEHAAVIPNPGPSVEVRHRWSYEACDKRTILCVGRFDLRKGADVMVRAFARVAMELPEAELLLVGPGAGIPREGKLVAPNEYLDSALSPTLRRRVHWLGSRPLAEIAELRRRAYVTVVASRYENHPLAVLEALAYGCPLLASRTGGIPEIVRDGTSGVLFESENDQDLARHLLMLWRHPQLAQRLGAEGAHLMHTEYSPRSVARQTLDYYASRLERWRAMSRQERLLWHLKALTLASLTSSREGTHAPVHSRIEMNDNSDRVSVLPSP